MKFRKFSGRGATNTLGTTPTNYEQLYALFAINCVLYY